MAVVGQLAACGAARRVPAVAPLLEVRLAVAPDAIAQLSTNEGCRANSEATDAIVKQIQGTLGVCVQTEGVVCVGRRRHSLAPFSRFSDLDGPFDVENEVFIVLLLLSIGRTM